MFLEGNVISSEDNGTIECCVEISGLPSGGLGCDVEVKLEYIDGSASMCRRLQSKVYHDCLFPSICS